MLRFLVLLVTLLFLTPPCPAGVGDLDFGPGPLRRDTLVRLVLERSPGIETARQAWRAAIEEGAQVSALQDPRLSNAVAPLSIAADVRFGDVFAISQRFPYPGKLRLRGEVARADAEAAGHQVEVVRLELATLASVLFDDYYYVHRALAINREHIELLTQFKQIAISRYEAGTAAQQDPIQAEVELAHLEHRRVVLESTRDVLVARMNALLHRSPDEPIPPPPGTLQDPPSLPEDSEGLQQSALASRPALRAQDSTIRARQFEVELRRKDFRPDFEVGTSWNSMWNTEEHRWIVGASINLPVRRKRLRSGVAQAEARWRSAQSARLQLEDDVRSEVQQAWTRAIESRHIVELHRSRLLPAANDQVQAALSGFKTGRNSFLAVIEAERNQRTTELGYERSLSELHQRLAELDRVLGRMPGGPRATMEPIAATGARP